MVLSDEEASRLIECSENLKHRTVLLTCYAAGLRLAEATHRRVADVDGQRGQIRVRRGKGSKERLVPASPRLLDALRAYWKTGRPANYLFPGKTPDGAKVPGSLPVHEAIQRRIDGCSYRFVFSQVNWDYENGRLTLRGCVPSFYLKQVLQELMRNIDDVEQINNHVDVVNSTGLSSEPRRKPR